MIKKLLLILFLFPAFHVNGQVLLCGFDSLHKANIQQHKTKKKVRQIEDIIFEHALVRNQAASRGASVVVTIPVVVHVIHNNGPENISDAQVIQGIQWLNESFSNSGYYNTPNGTDCEIQFCLALQDPQGNATTGIEHIQSNLTQFTMETQDAALKALSHWDPLSYLNIYTVEGITSLSSGPGVAGYAYFPSSHGNPEDGIVGEYTFLGVAAGSNSVFSHEAGHYLGLYHVFEGGCNNNNCLTDGDQVCDTPPDQSTANIPCQNQMNSCTTDEDDPSINNPFRSTSLGGAGDQQDLTHDFMDYGNIACFNLFTPGQKTRMQDAIQLVRYSLLQSQGCLSPCTNPVSASFTSSANNVSVGTMVNFTNTSTGTNLTHEWKVNGTTVATSLNYSQQFNNIGVFEVSLKITDNTPQCFDVFKDTVTVTCPIQAVFTASDTIIGPGDSVTFTSTVTGTPIFQWLLNGVPAGGANPWTQVFGNLGGYAIQLVAGNAQCSDTSDVFYVQVGQSSGNECAWWYFGDDAGLNFLPGGPVADLNNMLDFTQEGTATISDENGQLLFYTDGVTVYNRLHQLMANGSGLLAGLNSSTTQGALILKKPGSSTLYYIFTVDEEGGSNGFNYSIVDMTLNGGLGDITAQKNVQIMLSVSEKLTATRHCNGSDFWVLVHGMGTNTFYSFQLSATGLNMTPVTSSIGKVFTFTGIPLNESNSRGYLRINHTGTKAVSCILGSSLFELFDFDNSTGVFSNVYTSAAIKFLCYGAAFSPDDSKLYIQAGATGGPQRYMFQYDMMAGNGTAILASEQIVTTVPDIGAVECGPDGKLYYTCRIPGFQDYLSVVTNPNSPAAQLNYIQNGVYLGGKKAYSGLPNFMSNYFFEASFSLDGPDSTCVNSSEQFLIHFPFNFPFQFNWITGQGGTVLVINDSTATITFNSPGFHQVIVSPMNPCRYDADTITVYVADAGVSLGNDTLACNSTPILLTPGSGYLQYLWQDGSTLATYQATLAGTYWVEITDSAGCIARDTILVNHFTSPFLNLGNDTAVCEGGVVQIHSQAGFSSYQWQDGFNLPDYTAYAAGTYWLTVTDTCGGMQTDTLHITGLPPLSVDLGNDTTICDTASVVLFAGNGFTQYYWQDNSLGSTYTATVAGIYSVLVIDDKGCTGTDSVEVYVLADCDSVFPTEPFHFLIYPNPTVGNPVIDIGQSEPIGDMQVTIVDMLGQVVFDYTYSIAGNTVQQSLPLMGLASAVYYLRVQTSRFDEYIKFAIER